MIEPEMVVADGAIAYTARYGLSSTWCFVSAPIWESLQPMLPA